MEKIEVKKLELSKHPGGINRIFRSGRLKRTLVFILGGAVAGMLIFYFSEGQHLTEITTGDWLNSALLGGFFGFFITNSPCARGRC